MMKRVCILNGFLCLGYPALQYELRRRDDGTHEDFDYRGDAMVEGASVNMLKHGMYGPVSEYLSASEPTEASVQWKAGYEHGTAQKQRRHPGTKLPQAFRDGWRTAWSERRPFRFPDEIRAERNATRRKAKEHLSAETP